MRRAILTLGGTAAGLAALFSFKTHSLAGVAAISGTATPMASAPAAMAPGGMSSGGMSSGGMSSGGMSPAATPKSTKRAMASGTGTGMAGSSSAATAARVVTGAVANTQYGPMQVQLTLAGQRITKVTVLQQTNVGSRSTQIDATAIPQLTSETLAAQSAHIDAVSGATYTSAGYVQSLQSALDKLG
jgi:uncharacterized protein with FMN-binding domain